MILSTCSLYSSHCSLDLTSFDPLVINQKFDLHKGMLCLQVVKFFHLIVVEVYEFHPKPLMPSSPLLMHLIPPKSHYDFAEHPPNLIVIIRFFHLIIIASVVASMMFR
jgi:hypothetical protein